MIIRSNSYLSALALVALLSMGGCAANSLTEPPADPRMDRLLAAIDQSLENQGSVSTALQGQQQQLYLQRQQLESLSRSLSQFSNSPAVKKCPEVEVCPQQEELAEKMVVGRLEKVWIPDLETGLIARIDTAAETSSLDARNIELFERDGKRWVRFEIMNPETGKPMPLKRRLNRTVGIVLGGTEKVERRPVIKMGIIVGHLNQTAEFTLRDRRHKSYQVTIGRNILNDVMVVDVSKKNVAPYTLPDKLPDSSGVKD
jgi:hypothetical protein